VDSAAICVIIVIIIHLLVWIYYGFALIPQPLVLRVGYVGGFHAAAGALHFLPDSSLSIDLLRPFPHDIFGWELDCKVLNAWIALPKDLACIVA
jgi:hypothetical protein